MQPRFLIKTHGQVRNPRIFSLLVTSCTYPDRALRPERVAACLSDAVSHTGKPFRAAARFAVLMAKDLGFLNSNMAWAPNGYVLHTVLAKCGKTEQQTKSVLDLPYTPHERIAFLRYYLEADGAILWAIMKRVDECDALPLNELSATLQDIVVDLYRQHLNQMHMSRHRERIKREASRLSMDRWSKGTIPHKMWPHVQPLIDLGILDLSESRALRSTNGVNGPVVHSFIKQLDSLSVLETNFNQYRFFEIIANHLGTNSIPIDIELHGDELEQSLTEGYATMKNHTTGMVYVNALCDWVCIDLLASNAIVMERNDVRNYLRQIYRRQSGRIRFEVDFRGQPAFVVFQ